MSKGQLGRAYPGFPSMKGLRLTVYLHTPPPRETGCWYIAGLSPALKSLALLVLYTWVKRGTESKVSCQKTKRGRNLSAQYLKNRLRAQVFYERTVNEVQPS